MLVVAATGKLLRTNSLSLDFLIYPQVVPNTEEDYSRPLLGLSVREDGKMIYPKVVIFRNDIFFKNPTAKNRLFLGLSIFFQTRIKFFCD